MKITKYGTVIISEGPIRVDGWLVERELSDPSTATTEQLLLDFAITWAKNKFQAALNREVLNVMRARQQNPTEN
jgi:hypothetical protein